VDPSDRGLVSGVDFKVFGRDGANPKEVCVLSEFTVFFLFTVFRSC